MDAQVDRDVQIRRESLFTQMASAFARRDFDAVRAGVRPDVALTLEGASWLSGTYRGYEEFTQYVLGARLVLEPSGKQLQYLHFLDEMIAVHDFMVGGSALVTQMPLRVAIAYGPGERVESLVIRPRDQDRFDRAVNAFLLPEGYDMGRVDGLLDTLELRQGRTGSR